MKKFVIVAALIIAGMTSCAEEGDRIGPGLPGASRPSDAPGFEGDAVSDFDEARGLFNRLQNNADAFFGILREADEAALMAAFEIQYEESFEDYIMSPELMAATNISLDISINDDTVFAQELGADITASVQGRSRFSFNSNLTRADLMLIELEEESFKAGDRITMSASAARTFSITNGFINIPYGMDEAELKIAGIIITEYKGSEEERLRDPETNDWTGKNDDQARVAMMLSVFDSAAEKGAKFRFSLASDYSSITRSTSYSGGTSFSSIEIYDNNNALLFTIPSANLSDNWLNFAAIGIFDF
jgi:hypothetical protein